MDAFTRFFRSMGFLIGTNHIVAHTLAECMVVEANDAALTAPTDSPIQVVAIAAVGDELVALAATRKDQEPMSPDDLRDLLRRVMEAPMNSVHGQDQDRGVEL